MAKKRILVVDDEVDFLEILKKRLESEGYEVVTASDGKQAIEKVKKVRPDAVLLDIMMPEINGIDVLTMIREEDKELPVFMVTAFSNEERLKLANKLNASGYIIKTSDLKKELEKMKSMIEIADKNKR